MTTHTAGLGDSSVCGCVCVANARKHPLAQGGAQTPAEASLSVTWTL